MTKNILLVLGAFTVGFFVNKKITPSVSLQNPVQCENLSAAKDDLISLSQNEYLEYTKIKDLKQKYEKADELLGKVMLLFLADIGFKATKISVNEMEVKNLETKDVNPQPENTNIVESAPAIATHAATATTAPHQNNENLKGKSTLIRNLKTQAQIKEALDKAAIENPKIEAAKAGYPTQRQTKVLEGVYIGDVQFFDKKREHLSVTWEFIPDYSKTPIQGEFNYKITGGGNTNSSNGRGELRYLSTLADDPDGILVSTGDSYMQMYYNSVNEQLVGNYYEKKDGANKFERVGLVNLRK